MVYVSQDGSEEEYNQYRASMPWPALPFGGNLPAILASAFYVSTIPCLVLMDADGNLLSTDGVRLLRKHTRYAEQIRMPRWFSFVLAACMHVNAACVAFNAGCMHVNAACMHVNAACMHVNEAAKKTPAVRSFASHLPHPVTFPLIHFLRLTRSAFPWKTEKPPETPHVHPLYDRLLRREPVDPGPARELPHCITAFTRTGSHTEATAERQRAHGGQAAEAHIGAFKGRCAGTAADTSVDFVAIPLIWQTPLWTFFSSRRRCTACRTPWQRYVTAIVFAR